MSDSHQQKPNRRWYQFSLRTLLIVVTVFTVWLGIRVDQARRQRRAVEALRQISGDVLYINQFAQHAANASRFTKRESWAPEWLRKIVGADFVDRVRTVYLYDQTTDEHLANLEALPDVEALIVSSSNVTDAGVAHLGKLRRLKELTLGSAEVTDAGMVHLQALQELRYLQLACSVTDKGVKELSSLKKLEKLLIGPPTGFTSASHAAILTLEDSVTSEFIEMPLTEVVGFVGQEGGVQVGIDDQALQVAGISLEVGVTASVKAVPLHTALDRMLEPLGLGWMITRGGIVITTREVVATKHAGINRLRQSLPNLMEVYIVVE